MNINPEDTVQYIDTAQRREGGRTIVYHVNKQGIWDGTKVILNDKEQTTVYNLKWLTKVKSEEEIINETALEYSQKFKTQVSSEGLENIQSDFKSGIKFYKEYLSLKEAIK